MYTWRRSSVHFIVRSICTTQWDSKTYIRTYVYDISHSNCVSLSKDLISSVSFLFNLIFCDNGMYNCLMNSVNTFLFNLKNCQHFYITYTVLTLHLLIDFLAIRRRNLWSSWKAFEISICWNTTEYYSSFCEILNYILFDNDFFDFCIVFFYQDDHLLSDTSES